MSNVVSFFNAGRLDQVLFGPEALVRGVAGRRAASQDVLWLKENAELVHVMAATGQQVSPDTLDACFGTIIAEMPERIRFFPQYYRLLVTLALDLRTLGLAGSDPADLMRAALNAGTPQAELSDLQRAEARFLIERCGLDAAIFDSRLTERLLAFASQSRAFALPNKKAAYELTHIVFYLTGHGRRPQPLGEGKVARSLRYAGTVAWLEQNLDLLAEICLALRMVCETPPESWEDRLAQSLPVYRFKTWEDGIGDAFHGYLVALWHQLALGSPVLRRPFPDRAMSVVGPDAPKGALQELSVLLLGLGAERTADWAGMEPDLLPRLSEDARHIVLAAREELPDFDTFFSHFSRSAPLGAVA